MTHYISSSRLTLERMKEIFDNREKIALSHESTEAVIKCRKYLNDKMKDIDRPLYGTQKFYFILHLCSI